MKIHYSPFGDTVDLRKKNQRTQWRKMLPIVQDAFVKNLLNFGTPKRGMHGKSNSISRSRITNTVNVIFGW